MKAREGEFIGSSGVARAKLDHVLQCIIIIIIIIIIVPCAQHS